MLRNNGLSISLLAPFLIFWGAQAVCGFKVHNEDAGRHGKPQERFIEYLASGHFWQATGENWESEFLQMGCYVVMTSFLFQKGSAESNDPDEPKSNPPLPAKRKHGWVYRNSLGLAFMGLFALSFLVHTQGGLRELNQERAEHGVPTASMGEFLSDAEFWFQSFQNWQSEFLAVLSIVILTIFLRQDGSPESKPVDDPDSKTGS
jgi:hypothetical protein